MTTTTQHPDRKTTITAIRTALKARTGLAWSVRGGTGTAYGWITISAPRARCGEYGRMTDADCAILADALGLHSVDAGGEDVPDSYNHRLEYIARAEGREPEVYGKTYWD